MASAVTNQFNVSGAKDDSMSANEVNRDISADNKGDEAILQLVDAGFCEERIFNQDQYRMSMEMLEDPKLKDDEMYTKLVSRLSAWYLNVEKIKENGGPTEEQIAVMKKQGFNMEYRIKLYKCLRDLMIQIVHEKNFDVKKRQLRRTYEWFFQKLVAMGQLSKQEIEQELAFLDPRAGELKNTLKEVIKQKLHSALCNPEAVDKHNKAMYE